MSLQYALFGPIGLPEMLIILVIIVLIFGASRLPEIGKGIGQGIKNFKSSVKDEPEAKPSDGHSTTRV
jgi:sec-independent protein translocase protein TatA